MPSTRLDPLLDHVRRNVPFYRVNGGKDFFSFPIVSKEIMRTNVGAFLADNERIDRSALLRALEGPHRIGASEIPFGSNIIIDQTSGSSGLPFCFPKSNHERIAASFAIWRARSAIDPQVSSRNFYALIHAPPQQAQLPIVELLQHLAARQIRWLHGNPTIFLRCANLVRTGAIVWPKSIRYAESSGQRLDPETCSDIEKALGVRLVDQYGCREVWAVGYSTDGNRFHPLEESVFCEIVDDSDQPIHDSGRVGRLVVTALFQRLFPFIRYCTGDLAEWIEIDRPGRAFALQGHRPHEFIRGLSNVTGTRVFKGIMTRIYRQFGYVSLSHLQIQQRADRYFIVSMSRHPLAHRLSEAIAWHYNALNLSPHAAEFALEEKSAAPDGLQTEVKETIFTNIHWRPGEARK